MKLAIISHTEHYQDNNQKIVGWGSTVREINELVSISESIVHIAPLHKEKAPMSSLRYTSKLISFVPLIPSGGKGIKKITLLIFAPINLFRIHKAIKDVDYIQFRAPTGLGVFVLPFLKFFNRKKYWVKYAGNWKDTQMPLGNKFQKWWLKKHTSLQTKITVNGNWKGERKNVIAFENPCLDENDRLLGEKGITDKELGGKINFCFVGALNDHKGVDKIIEAFIGISSQEIGTVHFIGDGKNKKVYQLLSEQIQTKVVFHGFIPKDKIRTIYEHSHFILLPSKSEGFPKVIGEAMNFGCIPIVSNVSCIDQYITDGENGFLLNSLSVAELRSKILRGIHLDRNEYKTWILENHRKAEIFTYLYYISRIKNVILDS